MCKTVVRIWADRLIAKIELMQLVTYISRSGRTTLVYETDRCESIPLTVQIVEDRIVSRFMLFFND